MLGFPCLIMDYLAIVFLANTDSKLMFYELMNKFSAGESQPTSMYR
jgi:hypothetical protein